MFVFRSYTSFYLGIFRNMNPREGDVCIINRCLGVVVRVHRKFTVKLIAYPKYPEDSFEMYRFVAIHVQDRFEPWVHFKEGELDAAKKILIDRGHEWGSEAGRKPCEKQGLIRSANAERDMEVYREFRKNYFAERRANRGGRRGGHRGGRRGGRRNRANNVIPEEDGVQPEDEGDLLVGNDNLHGDNVVIPDVPEDVQIQDDGIAAADADEVFDEEYDTGIHDGEGILPVRAEVLGGENGIVPIEAADDRGETSIILPALQSGSHGNQKRNAPVGEDTDDTGELSSKKQCSVNQVFNNEVGQEDEDDYDDSVEESRKIEPTTPKKKCIIS